jgi:hypothetical protein
MYGDLKDHLQNELANIEEALPPLKMLLSKQQRAKKF